LGTIIYVVFCVLPRPP